MAWATFKMLTRNKIIGLDCRQFDAKFAGKIRGTTYKSLQVSTCIEALDSVLIANPQSILKGLPSVLCCRSVAYGERQLWVDSRLLAESYIRISCRTGFER